MVDAFATYEDLGQLLNRTFTSDEQPWITGLLDDASTYLRRDVIGAQVYPSSTSTFIAWTDECGDVPLPQFPVTAVSAVRDSAGNDVGFTLIEDRIHTCTRGQVTITLTYGYSTPPDNLRRWACVLVSQALLPLEQKLGLNAGGLSSVQIDDFKLAWANAGESSGMTLSDRNIASIRAQYAPAGAHVTGSR